MSLPSANNFIITLPGLIPSWFSASFHVFSTGIFILAGVCVFVTKNPVAAVPVIATSYSLGTGSSFIVYAISCSSKNFGRFSNTCDQFPFSSLDISTVSTTTSFANNFTVILSGLIPS